MQEFVTHSREETIAVGRELAKTLPAGALIAWAIVLGNALIPVLVQLGAIA